MLSVRNRLPRADSRNVFKIGKKIRGDYFEVTYLQTNTDNSRWLIIVPKKVEAQAHARNYIKRLISEALRSLMPNLKISIDASIYYKRKFSAPTLSSIQKQLVSLLTPFL